MRSFSEPVRVLPFELGPDPHSGVGESREIPTRGCCDEPLMSSKRTEEELASRTRRDGGKDRQDVAVPELVSRPSRYRTSSSLM